MAYSYSICLHNEFPAYKLDDICQVHSRGLAQDWLRPGDPELAALVLLRNGQELFGYLYWAEELSRFGGIQACGLLAL
jgi:hypothetical protein